MKRKSTAVIGMVVCFMMMASMAWSVNLPGVPNGTVTDGNLVWLENANCFGPQSWNQAMRSAASLKSGMCGLRDGSTAGQWRLPTKEELQSRQRNLMPAFYNVKTVYWSSSTYAGGTIFAWYVYMDRGLEYYTNKGTYFYVWPVRAGQ